MVPGALSRMQYGFVLDQRRCTGCHACTIACKAENRVAVGDFRTWVKHVEVGHFPAVRRHFAVLRCNQCTAAPCITICPVAALHRRPDGIVDLDRGACIGCQACMQACPYDAIYLDRATGAAGKCHFCAHRIDQGLLPACESVCPEAAIVSGDLHDPHSRVSGLLATVPLATVRRPELGIGPNVFYLGAHPAALEPASAREADGYQCSDRRRPKLPLRPRDGARLLRADARVVQDVGHAMPWGNQVAAHLVGKAVAAGAALWAPFLALSPAHAGALRDFAPEAVGLAFLALALLLAVLALRRRRRFGSVLRLPMGASWLVRGASTLVAFGALVAAILLARLCGLQGLAEGLRWTNLVGGSLAAASTAFLFAQCAGRDLWQRTRTLLPHLLVQALCAGGAVLLPFVPDHKLGIAAGAAALLHHALALGERLARHETHHARLAAALLPALPATGGSRLSAFHAGLATTTAAGLLGGLLTAGGYAHPLSLSLCAVLSLVGLLLHQRAWLHAGQLPPRS